MSLAALAISGCGNSRESQVALAAKGHFSDPVTVALVEAACAGNDSAVSRAIADGADVNKVGRRAVTPLYFAIYSGCLRGVRALLHAGADPNLVSTYSAENGETEPRSALLLALEKADISYLQELLSSGGNPNIPIDEFGHTLLFYVGDAQRARLLLSHGAKADQVLSDGKSPLLDAVVISRYSVANVLLEAGADPFVRSPMGTPLEVAIEFGERNTRPGSEERAAYEVFMKRVAEMQDKRAK